MSGRFLIAEIPLVGRGLIGTQNVNEVPIDGLIDADGITFQDGTLRKEGGMTNYNTVGVDALLLETGDYFLLEDGSKLLLEDAFASTRVVGGWDWNYDGNTQRQIVVCANGDIYKDSGAGTFATTLATGLTIDNNTVPVFVEGGLEASALAHHLFIFTGGNQVQVLDDDGATTGAIATPPADWGSVYPTFGFIHAGRLWGGGNSNDPHRLYFSTTDDHEDFTGTGSGTLAIFPGEGETLVNAVSYGNLVVVFKYPRGIYLVNTADPSVVNWTVTRLSSKFGSSWIGTVTQAGEEIVFMDAGGDVRVISAVDQFTDVGSSSVSDIAEMDDWVRQNIDFASRKLWRSAYYPNKREVHFSLTGIGSTTVNNIRLVFDMFKVGVPRFRYSTRDNACSFWLRQQNNKPVLMQGTDEFNIYNMDQDTRSVSGSGYTGRFQTPHTDLSHLDPGLASRRKNGYFLEAIIQPTGNWDLNCNILWDGVLRESVTFTQGPSAGGVLGSFVLGKDKLGAKGKTYSRKRRIHGGGRRFSVIGQNSNAGEDFSLARLFLHYKVGDERITQ